jgi:hypothetical protein
MGKKIKPLMGKNQPEMEWAPMPSGRGAHSVARGIVLLLLRVTTATLAAPGLPFQRPVDVPPRIDRAQENDDKNNQILPNHQTIPFPIHVAT